MKGMCDCPICKCDSGDLECEKDQLDEITEMINRNASINDIRSRISTLKDLVAVCIDCLQESQRKEIKEYVGNVLYYCVELELEKINKELRNCYDERKNFG